MHTISFWLEDLKERGSLENLGIDGSNAKSTLKKLYHNVQKELIGLRTENKGRDDTVGTATRYGLDGTGIESLWERDFPHLPGQALGLTQQTVQWVIRLLP